MAIMIIRSVGFSDAERAAGQCGEAALQRAAAVLAEDGIVVLRNAIDPSSLDVLRRRMQRDLALSQQDYELDDNWQGLRPPFSRPYLFRAVIFNRLMLAVSERALGRGQRLSGYQSNTAFAAGSAVIHADSPNREYVATGRDQRIHVDHCNARADEPPERCTFLVANIPLSAVDEANGATVVYPGTHLDCRCCREPTVSKFPTDQMLAEEAPGCRVLTQLGDVVLRDMRLWCERARRGRRPQAVTILPVSCLSYLAMPAPRSYGGGSVYIDTLYIHSAACCHPAPL
jgi:hypothetical protein